MSARRPRTSAERVRAYRERMRERGLRPVTFWVPDVTTPEFAAQARRESLAIKNSPGEQENIDFVESVSVMLE
ncbi:MAG: antitoxin MazE family protein [Tepidiformaceae bacterium]